MHTQYSNSRDNAISADRRVPNRGVSVSNPPRSTGAASEPPKRRPSEFTVSGSVAVMAGTTRP